ncbi:hypothetical protein M422DRAFT_245537 [Sphaerobolus stellatus SS14]|nr:hypothetical protein M422DRAFT_245537 [Sphaerobolus stellatus SS14]
MDYPEYSGPSPQYDQAGGNPFWTGSNAMGNLGSSGLDPNNYILPNDGMSNCLQANPGNTNGFMDSQQYTVIRPIYTEYSQHAKSSASNTHHGNVPIFGHGDLLFEAIREEDETTYEQPSEIEIDQLLPSTLTQQGFPHSEDEGPATASRANSVVSVAEEAATATANATTPLPSGSSNTFQSSNTLQFGNTVPSEDPAYPKTKHISSAFPKEALDYVPEMFEEVKDLMRILAFNYAWGQGSTDYNAILRQAGVSSSAARAPVARNVFSRRCGGLVNGMVLLHPDI